MAEYRIKCSCGTIIIRKCSKKTQFCAECAKKRAAASTAVPLEIRKQIAKLASTTLRAEIAKRFGISKTTLARIAKRDGFRFSGNKKLKNNPALTRRVCEYYARHGGPKTEKKFPGVCIYKIVEKYGRRHQMKPRLTKVAPSEILDVVRTRGLIGLRENGFRRNAIWARYLPKHKTKEIYINGLPWRLAKELVVPDCPTLLLKTVNSRRRYGVVKTEFHFVLWVDVEKHLKPGSNELVVALVRAMAKLQRWIFGTGDVHKVVENYLGGSNVKGSHSRSKLKGRSRRAKARGKKARGDDRQGDRKRVHP